jgi:hypothetical protein
MKSYKGLKKDYWLFWFASSLGMGASNILQYVLSLYVLDLTGSATLRMIGIASGAAGEMFFGLLNDATWVWLPIFLGAAGVAFASLLFRRTMKEKETKRV